MASSKIDGELVCLLRLPSFSPGIYKYDPTRHNIIEGVSKCIITTGEATNKFNKHWDIRASQSTDHNDTSKRNESECGVSVINRHFHNGETNKGLRYNSVIFAAVYTAFTLALDCYKHVNLVRLITVVNSFNTPWACTRYWARSGTSARFCWVPMQFIMASRGIWFDQLAYETLDHDMAPLVSVH